MVFRPGVLLRTRLYIFVYFFKPSEDILYILLLLTMFGQNSDVQIRS